VEVPVPDRRDRLTQEEAEARAATISDIAYDLDLDLEAGAKTFRGEVTITFRHHGGDTFLEWLGGSIDRFEVNGSEVEPSRDGSRIALPAATLDAENRLRVSFQRSYDHTGEGFHRFVDPEDGSEYLYTQFEPYSAHRLLPCFDQPDLKATYAVTVTAPEHWLVTTAGREISREDAGDGRTRRVFERTVPFSIYLMSVVAGEYRSVHDEHAGIPLGLHTRASLMPHLDADVLFDLTKRGIDFFGGLFAEPYPFGKYDQVFVPEFNWGGMENVGNVTYTDTIVFRDPPTEDQLTRRAEFFLHELAHMWFGDLVTLRWWNDLWLNESFASYVAYVALDSLGDYPTIWQDFNFRMKLWAYREDQRPTTHRIADEVPSTDETFLNFDGITYGKGAAALKQLVFAIGEDAFRDGLRTYFGRHRFGNATLHDFLAALQEGSGVDLLAWAARWLKTPSLNTLAVEWEEEDGRIGTMRLRQTAPDDHPYLRPHATVVAVADAGGTRREFPASIDGPVAEVGDAAGSAVPVFAFPNAGDHAYAKVRLDPVSLDHAREHLGDIDEPLLRQQVWASLWEMVRDQQLPSTGYLELIAGHMPDETSLPIVQLVTATAGGAIMRFVPEDMIDEAATRFVAVAADAIDRAPPGDLRVLWARALIGAALSEDDALVAARLVDDPPGGLNVDQEMRWAVAVRWSALDLDGAQDRIAAERERDPSDRGDRAVVAAGAARPDPESKQEVWQRLHDDGGYPSLHLSLAAAGGFWQRHQAPMLERYIAPFFDGLPEVFATREPEAARAYFRAFLPQYLVDDATRERIGALLLRDDIGPMLRRLLVEADDDIDRAIKCRRVARGE
jgi:aminopeptidase N